MVDCIAQKSIDYKFTKGLLWLINLDLILNNILAFCNVSVFTIDKSGGLDYLFNYLQIIVFLYVFFFYIFKRFKMNFRNGICILFLLFLTIGSVLGVQKGQYNIKFLSHVFEFIMPVFMIWAAGIVIKEVYPHHEFAEQAKGIAVRNTWMYIIGVIVFRICHALGLVYYPAYGSGVPDFTLPYLFFCLDNPMLAYAGTVACIFSGKRAMIVKACLVITAYFFSKKRSIKSMIIDFVLLASIGVIFIYISKETQLLDRVLFTIEKTFGDNANLDAASSGRAREINTIVSVLDQSPVNWILGCGFGVRVSIPNAVVRSYSHFTPLAYTLICGAVFTLILYSWLIINMCRCFLNKSSNYRMCGTYMLIIIVGSMMGAALLNVPKYWLIIGGVASVLNNSNFKNHED